MGCHKRKEKQDVLDRKKKERLDEERLEERLIEYRREKEKEEENRKQNCCSSNSNTMTLRGPKRFYNRTLNELKSSNSL
jgi:hypothetical protein